jgi:hypothetical protein
MSSPGDDPMTSPPQGSTIWSWIMGVIVVAVLAAAVVSIMDDRRDIGAKTPDTTTGQGSSPAATPATNR